MSYFCIRPSLTRWQETSQVVSTLSFSLFLGLFPRLIYCKLILNLQTGSISPQYHLVHDDWFSTVSNASSSSLTQTLWDQLISTGYECKAFDSAITEDTWLESEPSILRENLGPGPVLELNYSDQTNQSDEGESSEDDSGNSPSHEGASEGANDPSLEGARPDGATEGANGARPIRTRRPNL